MNMNEGDSFRFVPLFEECSPYDLGIRVSLVNGYEKPYWDRDRFDGDHGPFHHWNGGKSYFQTIP